MTLLSLLLAVAHADPATGQAMISADDGVGCSLSIDGEAKGVLPLRVDALASGSHTFTIDCQGRKASIQRDVATAPGKLATVKLDGFSLPPAPAPLAGSVPTYVLLSRILGEKVRIDGGEVMTLPVRLHLSPGPHEFVVLAPDGSVRTTVTKDVVAVNGQAVVKLD